MFARCPLPLRSMRVSSLGALAALAATLLSPAPARAGVIWKSELTVGEDGEKPASPFLRTVRIDGLKMRIDGGKQSVIVRLDRGLVWTMHHEDRVYQELPFEQIGMMMANMKSTLDTFPPEQRQQIEAMFKRMATPFTRVEVTPTGESRKVAGHPCRVYTIRGGPVESTVCAATDRKPAPDATRFYAAMAEKMAATPGLDSLRAQAEAFTRLEGIAVQERSSMQTPLGEKSEVYELVSYDTAELAPDVFELPAGLTRAPNMLDQMRSAAAAAEAERDAAVKEPAKQP